MIALTIGAPSWAKTAADDEPKNKSIESSIAVTRLKRFILIPPFGFICYKYMQINIKYSLTAFLSAHSKGSKEKIGAVFHDRKELKIIKSLKKFEQTIDKV